MHLNRDLLVRTVEVALLDGTVIASSPFDDFRICPEPFDRLRSIGIVDLSS